MQIQIRGRGIEPSTTRYFSFRTVVQHQLPRVPRHGQPDFFLMRAARSLGEENTREWLLRICSRNFHSAGAPYDAHSSAVPRSRAMMRDNQAKVQYSVSSGD